MSWFSTLKERPLPETFFLTKQFTDDDFPQKVNLSIGAYRTDEGKPWVLPCVRAAERALVEDETLNKEYLPVLGLDSFSILSTRLLLGEDSPALSENRAFGLQTVAATSALRVGAEFLVKLLGRTIFYCSDPFYENHKIIFSGAGFKEARFYRCWNAETRTHDIEGFLEDLNNASEGSVILLQACGQNPTGYDPSEEEWVKIAEIVKRRKLFPFFDAAYQGFVSGDLDKDVWAVRYFVSQGIELFCAQSFSKNLGIYNERLGNLTIVMNNASDIPAVKSHITITVRGLYSTPPNHGARVFTHILSNKDLFNQWKDNIKIMYSRVTRMRHLLRKELERIGTPGTWNHITEQAGMFSYTGLNEAQSQHMVKKHHVYMLRSGRINICGLTPNNIEYVAKSIKETLTSIPAK